MAIELEDFIDKEVATAFKDLQQYVKPGGWFDNIAPLIIKKCVMKTMNYYIQQEVQQLKRVAKLKGG
jgi:hypothetical protein